MYDPKPIDMSDALRQVYEGKKLDPVGQEDKDIDNDGDHDKSDKYLLNRRKVRGKVIKTRKEEVDQFVDSLTEEELDLVLEFIGGKKGDGYIGHPNLDIKNPLAKTQTKSPTGNTGVAGRLGDRKMKMDAMMKGYSKGGSVKKEEYERDHQEQFRMDRVVSELYKGKHGQSEKEYQDGRSDTGKMVSGDSKMSGAKYTHGRRVDDGGAGPQEAGGSKKPKAQGRMDKGARADLEYRKANLKKQKKESVIYELGQLSEEQLDEIIGGLLGGLMNMGKKGGFMKGASTGIGGLAGQVMGKKPTARGFLGFSKGGEKKKVKKESLAFSEEEGLFIEQCDFNAVTDEELIEFFEDAIIELAEDDQDFLEICEELEICGILMEQEDDDDDKKKPSNMERLKSAAAKAGERLKAGAKKVIGMGARAAGHAAGEFQAQRKKSKKDAMERGKGDGEKKKSDDSDKTGGKLDDILSSIRNDAKGKSNSGGESSDSAASASSGGGGSKKPSFIQRVGGALKGALKKGVGRLSRAVSKGSDRLASRMGEDYEQIAHLYDTGLFTIQEIEHVIEEGYKEIDKKKENSMYRRAGNLARKSLSSDDPDEKEKARKKSAKIVSAIASQKENERFKKMGDEKARNNYGG